MGTSEADIEYIRLGYQLNHDEGFRIWKEEVGNVLRSKGHRSVRNIANSRHEYIFRGGQADYVDCTRDAGFLVKLLHLHVVGQRLGQRCDHKEDIQQ